MPTKPIKTADHLLIPTVSPKTKIDAIVTKIGPAKVRETTSARGKFLRPKKIQIKAVVPAIALNACNPGLEVL